MATITVTCNICNTTLLSANGPELSQNDANNYQTSCSCSTDGPFQTYDDNGNPLPMNYSNIVATLTE
jgi:hypothetical protein